MDVIAHAVYNLAVGFILIYFLIINELLFINLLLISELIIIIFCLATISDLP